jgi:hypothetical protein
LAPLLESGRERSKKRVLRRAAGRRSYHSKGGGRISFLPSSFIALLPAAAKKEVTKF